MRARPPHAPAQGPMLASARRRALKATAVYGVLPVFSHNVGRAISPALQHKAHGPQNREQRAAAPPAKRGARPCRTLRDISAANRQCTPQSAPSGASSSPCRGAFLGGRRPKSLPCKGRCRRRRRRGAAPCPANIFPGRRILPATIHPAKHGERPFPATALSRPPHTPAWGPMLASARRRVLKTAAVYGSLPLFGRNVGREISPAAWALWIHRLCGMAFCISRLCPRRRTPPRRA